MATDNDAQGIPPETLLPADGLAAEQEPSVVGPSPVFVTDFSISYAPGAALLTCGQARSTFSPGGDPIGIARAWQMTIGMSPQNLKTLYSLLGRAVEIYENRHGTIKDFTDSSAAEEK